MSYHGLAVAHPRTLHAERYGNIPMYNAIATYIPIPSARPHASAMDPSPGLEHER